MTDKTSSSSSSSSSSSNSSLDSSSDSSSDSADSAYSADNSDLLNKALDDCGAPKKIAIKEDGIEISRISANKLEASARSLYSSFNKFLKSL